MATFTVTTLQDVVDGGDGEVSLREAVRRSNRTEASDTIRFETGLEGGTVVLRGSQLTLREDVRIDGDRNEDGTGVTIDANDRSRVFEISSSDDFAFTNLDGLTVTGGLSGGDGGGVLLRDGRLEITDSRITDNEGFRYSASYGDGGGIFVDRGASLSLARSIVDENNGTNGGGIFAADDSVLTIRRSTVEDNIGSAYRNGDGGGIYLDGAYARVNDSTIADNSAAGNGSGIFAGGSRLVLEDSTVSGNAGTYRLGSGQGGGIYAGDGSDISLQSVTVTGNSSGRNADYGTAGGGIFIAADGTGSSATSTLSLSDSIVAGNFNGEFGDAYNRAVAEDIDGRITDSNGSNIFGSAVTGNRPSFGDLEGVDPALIFAAIDPETGGGRLRLNGGPTETVRLRDSADNPALDAAFDADSFDQRGFVRPRPDGTFADIGAFELDQRSGREFVASAERDGRGDELDLGANEPGFDFTPTADVQVDHRAWDTDVLI